MQVEFLSKFSKDLDNVHQKSVKLNLLKIILLLETEENLISIPNLKKLKGHKTAFRIRIGDYRVGFFYEDDIITLARFLHRKDIYKTFPNFT